MSQYNTPDPTSYFASNQDLANDLAAFAQNEFLNGANAVTHPNVTRRGSRTQAARRATSHAAKKPEGHIPRPPNCFLLYRSWARKQKIQKGSDGNKNEQSACCCCFSPTRSLTVLCRGVRHRITFMGRSRRGP